MGTRAKKIIREQIIPHVDPGDWTSPGDGEDHFSANQLIAAYEAGIKTGKESADRLLREKFQENLTRIGTDTQKIVDLLLESGFTPESAVLKVINWDEFEVLIVLPERELLRHEIARIYEAIGQLMNGPASGYYKIDIILAGQNESFNWKKVSSDGFRLYHKSLIRDGK